MLSAVLLVDALRPELTARAGRVVLLSSVAALRGSGGGPYGAMKAALHAWAFDLARELGSHQGTANVIARAHAFNGERSADSPPSGFRAAGRRAAPVTA